MSWEPVELATITEINPRMSRTDLIAILLLAQSVQFIAGELLRAQALEAADDGVFF